VNLVCWLTVDSLSPAVQEENFWDNIKLFKPVLTAFTALTLLVGWQERHPRSRLS